MTPIDDELRDLLHGRASALTPSPDPLAGIEHRAKRIRRNRVAASVAGSALAVAAVAVAVPAIAPSSTTTREAPLASATAQVSEAPTASPTAVSVLNPYALDPAAPWAYRGNPEVIAQGSREAFTSEWATSHRLSADQVTWSPLHGEVWEPSQQAEIVYVATEKTTGKSFVGVGVSTESGPEFRGERALDAGTTVVMVPLAGDEIARVRIVASPQVDRILYAKDGTEYQRLAPLAPGVATTALEDMAKDSLRVTAGQQLVYEGDVPDYSPESSAGDPQARPDNLLVWPTRGAVSPEMEQAAVAAYAKATGKDPAEVGHKVLLGGGTDNGREFLFGQFWGFGEDAQTFGLIRVPGQADEVQLGEFTPKGISVLAWHMSAGPGETTDTLAVVPQPQTGQVLYGEAGSEYRPVGEGQDFLDGAVLVDRRPGVQGDKLKLLDGNGVRYFEGEVAPLLCGAKGCG